MISVYTSAYLHIYIYARVHGAVGFFCMHTIIWHVDSCLLVCVHICTHAHVCIFAYLYVTYCNIVPLSIVILTYRHVCILLFHICTFAYSVILSFTMVYNNIMLAWIHIVSAYSHALYVHVFACSHMHGNTWLFSSGRTFRWLHAYPYYNISNVQFAWV